MYNTKIHSEGRLDIHTIQPTAINNEVVLTVSTFSLEGAVKDVVGCASLCLSWWVEVMGNTNILFDSGSTACMLVPTFSSTSWLEQASENKTMKGGKFL
jgi:hypothetical protein